MTDQHESNGHQDGHRRSAAILIVLVLFVGAAAVYAVTVKRDRGGTPRLLNQPTEARVVKPLSDKPDKRFAPLPLEPEKHEK